LIVCPGRRQQWRRKPGQADCGAMRHFRRQEAQRAGGSVDHEISSGPADKKCLTIGILTFFWTTFS
jgi:hypothetical protein